MQHVQGMLFIQSMARQAGTRIIHRDLHSDNVLIESVGGGEPRARVHDFGHARCFDHTKHMSVKHMSTAGMAPEMLQKDAVHNEKVDIYQFGEHAHISACKQSGVYIYTTCMHDAKSHKIRLACINAASFYVYA